MYIVVQYLLAVIYYIVIEYKTDLEAHLTTGSSSCMGL